MKTTTDEVKQMLLSGMHINKIDMFYRTHDHSSCLAQRIYDIKNDPDTCDWKIQKGSVKGKGTLREYWLDPEEIERIILKGNLSKVM